MKWGGKGSWERRICGCEQVLNVLWATNCRGPPIMGFQTSRVRWNGPGQSPCSWGGGGILKWPTRENLGALISKLQCSQQMGTKIVNIRVLLLKDHLHEI